MKKLNVLLALALLFLATGIYASTNDDRYAVLYNFNTPLTNQTTNELPYSVTGTMYGENGWQLPRNWNQRTNKNYAYVVDFNDRVIHNILVNKDVYYVLIWNSWELGSDGHPHPIAAYWIELKEGF